MPLFSRKTFDTYSGGERKPYRLKYKLGRFDENNSIAYLNTSWYENSNVTPPQTTVPAVFYLGGARRIIYVPFLNMFIALYGILRDETAPGPGRSDRSWYKITDTTTDGIYPPTGWWRTYPRTIGRIDQLDSPGEMSGNVRWTIDQRQSDYISGSFQYYAGMNVSYPAPSYTPVYTPLLYTYPDWENDFHDIVVLDNRIVAATNTGPAVSTDGINWSFVDTSKPIRKIIKSGSNLIALGNENFYNYYNYKYTINTFSKYSISTDNGNTWSSFNTLSSEIYEVVIKGMVLCGSSILMYGGKINNSSSTRPSPTSGSYAITVGAGEYGLWISTNNGSSFTQVSMNNINQTAAVTATGRNFAVWNDTNAYSIGSGAYSADEHYLEARFSWQDFKYFENENLIIGYMDGSYADSFAGGTGNISANEFVIYSTDNGVSWTVDIASLEHLRKLYPETYGYYNSRLNKYIKFNSSYNSVSGLQDMSVSLYINDTNYYIDSKIRSKQDGGDIGASGVYTQYKGKNWNNYAGGTGNDLDVSPVGNAIKIEGVVDDQWLVFLQGHTTTNEYLIVY